MTKAISYSKLESTLSKLGAQMNAAETHGLLTGMLTLANPAKTDTWRATLLENLDCADPDEKQWGIFSATSSQIMQDFTDPNFAFKLMLPGDNLPLEDRIDALGYWCRGYLSGLGLIGITQDDLTNPIVKELVQDLSQIAHVSMETDASDEDENNFMELVEFVRVAVQNIQIELQGLDIRKLH